jgi:hypothetical protein
VQILGRGNPDPTQFCDIKMQEKRADNYTKTLLKLHKNQKKDGSKKDLA